MYEFVLISCILACSQESVLNGRIEPFGYVEVRYTYMYMFK